MRELADWRVPVLLRAWSGTTGRTLATNEGRRAAVEVAVSHKGVIERGGRYIDRILLVGHLIVGHLGEAAKCVDQPHLLDG